MADILNNVFAFTVYIVLGALGRHFNVFDERERNFLAKIVLNVTLPSALASGLSNLSLTPQLMSIFVMGIAVNAIFLLFGWINSRKMNRQDRIFSMLCTPGFSVVLFVLPYARGFMGHEATVSASVFEVGNGLMVLGVTGAIVSAILGGESQQGKLKLMFRQLTSSVPFLVSIVMLLLAALSLRLPAPVQATVDLVAASNSFLSMLMLGTLIDLSTLKRHRNVISRVLALRYFLSGLIAAAIYFCFPASSIVRYTLVLALFSPITSISALMTGRLGGSKEVAGLAISASIIVSTVFTVGILVLGSMLSALT